MNIAKNYYTKIKLAMFILSLTILFLNYFPFNFLNADSYLYIRQAENYKHLELLGDSIKDNNVLDSRRVFPYGNIPQFDLMTFTLITFDKLFPWLTTEQNAHLATILFLFINTALLGVITWLLTRKTTYTNIVMFVYLMHPATKLFLRFDKDLLRLSFVLYLLYVFYKLFLRIKSKRYRNWIILSAFIIFFLGLMATFSRFNIPFANYYSTQYGEVIKSNYENKISELRQPTFTQIMLLFPNIALILMIAYATCKIIQQLKSPAKNLEGLLIIELITVFLIIISNNVIRSYVFLIPLLLMIPYILSSFYRMNKAIIVLLTMALLFSNVFVNNTSPTQQYFQSKELSQAVHLMKNIPDSVVLTRWDIGYYLQYAGNLKTFVDGATFNHQNADFVSDVLSKSEKDSYDQLVEFEKLYDANVIILVDHKTHMASKSLQNNSVILNMQHKPESLKYYKKIFENNKLRLYMTKWV